MQIMFALERPFQFKLSLNFHPTLLKLASAHRKTTILFEPFTEFDVYFVEQRRQPLTGARFASLMRIRWKDQAQCHLRKVDITTPINLLA